ncbi:hypothetical protein [Roseateles sp.]|uniref:hypothetical protein n=1 Tax=Roseateles sp. TaxID=1971397 RepID=UPI003BA671C2
MNQHRCLQQPKRRSLAAMAASLALTSFAFLVPATPAEASEVVKLARLVITGKRLSSMPQARPESQQLPRVTVEGRQTPAEVRVAEDRRAQFQPI